MSEAGGGDGMREMRALLDVCFAILEAFDLSPDGIEIRNEAVTARNFDLAFRSPLITV